ncbi:MAG: Gfo/Idh/MocA family oxidoreductase [Deltaproteobacteria bacterium]|nr:Gfo/Idh/MocA family oxidoreductase [Deltaproteobacteria bacterium]
MSHTDNNRIIRLGIIGSGSFVQSDYLPNFSKINGVKISAICGNTPEKVKSLTSKYGIPGAYTDWRDMLNVVPLDAVAIATPNYLHDIQAIEVLKHGYHVFVEKPMAITLGRAKKMVALAKASRKILMINQSKRFSLPFITAKDFIIKGGIGKIYSINLRIAHSGPDSDEKRGDWFFDKKRAGGGAILDLGIHMVDLARYLTNDDIIESYNVATQLVKRGDVEDNGILIAKTKENIVLSVEASWTSFRSECLATIYGENGVLFVSELPEQKVEFTNTRGKKESIRLLSKLPVYETNPYQHFISSIRGETKCRTEGSDVIKSLRVIIKK